MKVHRVLCVLALGAASLVACGGDDDDDDAEGRGGGRRSRRGEISPATEPPPPRAARPGRPRRQATVAEAVAAAASWRCGSARAVMPRWSTPSWRRGTRRTRPPDRPDLHPPRRDGPQARPGDRLGRRARPDGPRPHLGPQFASAGQLEDITDLIGDDPTLETIPEGHSGRDLGRSPLRRPALRRRLRAVLEQGAVPPGRARPGAAANQPHRAPRHGGRDHRPR